MKKSNMNEKGINYVLDTRQINDKKQSITLFATESEKTELAKWYEIPAIKSLSVEMNVHKKEDIITVQGKISAETDRECVITGKIFEQPLSADFTLLFSTTPAPQQPLETDIDMEEEPAEYLPRGQIYFKDIVTEQFGLNLDPFPKSTNEFFEYRENDTVTEKENPFAVLKRLTKA